MPFKQESQLLTKNLLGLEHVAFWFYMLGDTLDLLCQAAQHSATLSDNEAAQLIKTASDDSQDSNHLDSDKCHLSSTVSTPLAFNEPPPLTVDFSQPLKRK